jgi:hypothetical protein
VFIGTAIAVPIALWIPFFSGGEGSGTLAQDGASSEATQSLKARDAVVSSEDPATNSTASAELELQPGLDQSSDLISIGEYIDPDRGADLSQPIETIEIGEYIDPERGADYSEPSNPIEIGEYIDPDRGAMLEVNPLEVLSIGAFIDPDSLSVTVFDETVEVGEYVDPD